MPRCSSFRVQRVDPFAASSTSTPLPVGTRMRPFGVTIGPCRAYKLASTCQRGARWALDATGAGEGLPKIGGDPSGSRGLRLSGLITSSDESERSAKGPRSRRRSVKTRNSEGAQRLMAMLVTGSPWRLTRCSREEPWRDNSAPGGASLPWRNPISCARPRKYSRSSERSWNRPSSSRRRFSSSSGPKGSVVRSEIVLMLTACALSLTRTRKYVTLIPSPHYGQYHVRRPRPVVVHGVVRRHHPPVLLERLARVRVQVEARKVAARNVEADPVPLLKEVGRRVEVDPHPVDPPRLHELRPLERAPVPHARDGVADVEVEAEGVVGVRRVLIDELRGEVRVGRRGRDLEDDLHRPRDLDVPLQGLRAEDE